MAELITLTEAGLCCPSGGFHVDPAQPVPLALVTHAHADHVVPGAGRYVGTEATVRLLRARIPDAQLEPLPYGERRRFGDVEVSLHPAGHVLGSAQVRVERRGEVWVVSGDYKRQPDPTCAPFEPMRCDVFITEATFGLPVYRWDRPGEVVGDILSFWEEQRAGNKAAVLYTHSLSKGVRLLAELARVTERTVYLHGAVAELAERYRQEGIRLLPTERVVETARRGFGGELVIAPLSARGTPWVRRLGDSAAALVSGWMRVRGERRRRNLARGFALSDHADFPALLATVQETHAQRVGVVHGYQEPFARYLRALGLDAHALTGGPA